MLREGTDLMLTHDGDLYLDERGDLATVSGDNFIVQSVYNRLRSVTVGWFYDHVGADLEDFIGKPNTRETADVMARQVLAALTADGLVGEEDLFIKPVPLDRSVVALFVFVRLAGSDKPAGFQVEVDLDGGVSVKYIKQREGIDRVRPG